MVEMIGAAVTMLGGASLCASSITLARAARPIALARDLLGDTDTALPSPPADMLALLATLTSD